MDISTIGTAFSVLGVAFAMNPTGFRSPTISWVLIVLGVVLLFIGAFQKRVAAPTGRVGFGEWFLTAMQVPIIAGLATALVVAALGIAREWVEGALPNHELTQRVDQLTKEVQELETRPAPSPGR